MKIIAPEYFKDFECLKGGCRHSCCAGWEIDIDEDTLEYYASLPEEQRRWLESNIDGAHFHLTEDGKCPFLRSDGLCEMIIRLGTDALCDICIDHPLFRNEFTGRTEIGFGLCCEAACALAIGQEGKVGFVCAGDDGAAEMPDAAETKLLSERDEMIMLAQKRELPIAGRIAEIEKYCGIAPCNVPELSKFMSGLEMMDARWGELLSAAAGAGEDFPKGKDAQLEQLLVYLIYRHSLRPPEFACAMFRIICAVAAAFPKEDFLEICRLFSSEIEYSDENPEKITEFLINRLS